MAGASVSNTSNLFKRLWGNDVAKPMYEKSKFLDACKKDTSYARGEGRYVVVNIAPTAGHAATFADAVAAQDPTADVRFFVEPKKEYSVFTVQNEAIERSKGNAAAVVEVLKHQAEKARQSFAESMARRAWGAGGGSIGQLDSAVNLASTTLKVRSRTDIIGLFNKGTQLEFASDDGSGTSPVGRRGAPDRLTVVSVDRDAGTAVLSGALNTVNSITADDYIFRRGDYGAAVTGLPGWCPPVAPTSALFMGLDRTVDVLRTSGTRVTGSGGNMEEVIEDAGAECALNGIDPKKLFMNPLRFKNLIKLLGSKVVLQDGQGVVGMKAVKIYVATGAIDVVPEPYVPYNYFWLCDPSDVTLGSAGDCPMMLTQGAGKGDLMLLDNDDALQGRLGAYLNLYHNNPGNTCIGSW